MNTLIKYLFYFLLILVILFIIYLFNNKSRNLKDKYQGYYEGIGSETNIKNDGFIFKINYNININITNLDDNIYKIETEYISDETPEYNYNSIKYGSFFEKNKIVLVKDFGYQILKFDMNTIDFKYIINDHPEFDNLIGFYKLKKK